MVDGKSGPICPFVSKANVVTVVREPKILSGRLVRAVDSICRLNNDVRLLKDAGNDPAGMALLPIICSVWRPSRPPNSFGKDAGTPGNVSCNEETRPVPSHDTPVQAQNCKFCNQLIPLKVLCPFELADSKTALRPQN